MKSLQRKFSLVVFVVLANSFVTSFLFATEKEELDKVLRNELGTESKQEAAKTVESKSETKKVPKTEINPVEERYRRTEDESGSFLSILVKTILVFGILAVAMYYVLKYISRNRNIQFPVSGMMRVLSSISIAPGKQLQIVDIAGTLYVLGVSEHSVNLITEITDSDTKSKIFQAKETAEPPLENFLEILAKNFKNFDIKNSKILGKKFSDESDEEVLDEIKIRQQQRLEELKKERTTILSKDKNNEANFF
jgi:flagellar protein FliO/FliZ